MFTPDDIKGSPLLQLLSTPSSQPTVFLPNYGEFGSTICKSMRMVHFYQCPEKVVCCRPGEAVLFPSAKPYYEWDDFVLEEHRWGLFTKTRWAGRERMVGYCDREKQEQERIQNAFPGYRCVRQILHSVDETHYEKYLHTLTFKLTPHIQNINVDVVISPRGRKCRSQYNFHAWEDVVQALKAAGYTVGCVGDKKQSMEVAGVHYRSWDYEYPTDAVIEMLTNCKLYLALDTGTSHLAAFLSTPMILFSPSVVKYSKAHLMRQVTRGYFLDLGTFVSEDKVIAAALTYLKL